MVEQTAAAATALDAIFHALADGTRRAILRDLGHTATYAQGKTVGELAKPYRMSLAAVSKHLQVLERAQLVERERQGQFQRVRLRPGTLRTAQEWLSFYETFWSASLDRMQAALETQTQQDERG